MENYVIFVGAPHKFVQENILLACLMILVSLWGWDGERGVGRSGGVGFDCEVQEPIKT